MSKIPDISTNRQLHSSGQHEEKNTISVNQSSNPTNLQEALCHDGLVDRTMALLGSTLVHYTLPWLYLALPHSDMALLDST